VHVDDPGSDPAERQVLHRLGHASLLLVPLIAAGEPIGILELAHRTHRRWTSHDVAHARGLAEHVSNAIMRIGAAR
jgi:GAF domain-containing protein